MATIKNGRAEKISAPLYCFLLLAFYLLASSIATVPATVISTPRSFRHTKTAAHFEPLFSLLYSDGVIPVSRLNARVK